MWSNRSFAPDDDPIGREIQNHYVNVIRQLFAQTNHTSAFQEWGVMMMPNPFSLTLNPCPHESY